MKVIARHWLNYNGVWHKAGEEFEVDDFEAVKEYVDVRPRTGGEEFVSEVFPPEPKKRGRAKKD